MFNVGDVVELDLDAEVNNYWGGIADEIKYLETFGLIPHTAYVVEHIEYDWADAEEGEEYPPLVQLEGVKLDWSADRFKPASPLNLENE
ncbi:hypothetical protein [Citrobacter phage CVT22]|uniref:Uncharacterized protein n=1 Tax=Citrobacter phage CVT22 TaxID=1622234 RepID=A0A0R6CQ86_9CAUD|nr:hypothetical protein APL39_gp43 [Citrobacter phage CVT22]AJT60747.2 hypothetical protein [Citrobacter phage CVT22]